MNKGKLFLLPTPLGDIKPEEVIPQYVFEVMKTLKVFVVEELRTARRYLSQCGFRGQIDTLTLFELNEHTPTETVREYIKILLSGENVGLISEAGLPAVADPGADLVAAAHVADVEVVPFVGPSSLMMALMSSGLNGQSFAFVGYLPAKTPQRRERIKELEKYSGKMNQSQIFIETPYRNDSLLADLFSVCADDTRLTVAADITLPEAYIKTKTIAKWRKSGIVVGKRPCVFILLR